MKQSGSLEKSERPWHCAMSNFLKYWFFYYLFFIIFSRSDKSRAVVDFSSVRTSYNSFNKWTKISSLEIIIFELTNDGKKWSRIYFEMASGYVELQAPVFVLNLDKSRIIWNLKYGLRVSVSLDMVLYAPLVYANRNLSGCFYFFFAVKFGAIDSVCSFSDFIICVLVLWMSFCTLGRPLIGVGLCLFGLLREPEAVSRSCTPICCSFSESGPYCPGVRWDRLLSLRLQVSRSLTSSSWFSVGPTWIFLSSWRGSFAKSFLGGCVS